MAALIMREILQALQVAQKEGLIHRDLRAENILVKQKLVGINKHNEDTNQCPVFVQIINFGQNPE